MVCIVRPVSDEALLQERRDNLLGRSGRMHRFGFTTLNIRSGRFHVSQPEDREDRDDRVANCCIRKTSAPWLSLNSADDRRRSLCWKLPTDG